MKKFYTIIIIIFLLILAGIGYVLFTNTGKQAVDSQSIFDSARNFFPFGKPNQQTVNSTSTNNSNENNNINPTERPIIEKLFEISPAPVSGFVSFEIISTSTKLSFGTTTQATTSTSTKKTQATTTKETDTFVRFMERATGHVYDAKIPTIEKTRVSNTTSPKTYETIFNSKGTEAISRFLNGESINTIYTQVSTSTATTSVKNIVYPFGTDIVINKKDSIFYTVKSTNGSVGYLTTFDRKKSTQVFTSPLQNLLAAWSGGDIVAVFPKPHSEYPGVLFFVNTKTGTTKQILSGVNGLTALPNKDATYFLYNTNPKNLNLAAEKVSSKIDANLQIKTLPEKCVWSQKNVTVAYCAVPNQVEEAGYPEKWYQGVVSFNDSVYKIDISTGEERLVYNPSAENKGDFDITNLILNEKENYLFFINKKDLTLWGLSVE